MDGRMKRSLEKDLQQKNDFSSGSIGELKRD